MNTAIVPAIAGFALVATITPGPNNIMVMTSGANFGFRRTTPHLLGVVTGFVVMIVLTGIGLMAVFSTFPVLNTILKVVSVGYLLFLAWKIGYSAPSKAQVRMSRPLTFFQAAAFQWVNPKAWAMGLTAITLYAPDHSFPSVALIAIAFTVIGLPANSLWALMGTVLRCWLSSGSRLRILNFAMALLLVTSLYPVLFS